MECRVSKIPKGNGKFRTIFVPSEDAKLKMKACIPYLESVLDLVQSDDVSFGFQRGKNCVLNAEKHIGYQYTLTMDVADFFDSIKEDQFGTLIPDDIKKICFYKGSPRQGFPSSPVIANIAFAAIDTAILAEIRKFDIECVYTRYADDMAFSYNSERDGDWLKGLCKSVVTSFGFELNSTKTQVQSAAGGRRIITGIGVDSTGVHPTRKVLKKMRAAKHQGNIKSLEGLKEWASCKRPSS